MGEKKSTFSLNKDLQSLICTVRCSFWQPTFFMSPDYGLHGLHGTMPPSCSVFPCARGNGLSVPQLLASSTHSQTAEKKKKKAVRLFCITRIAYPLTAALCHGCHYVEVLPITWPHAAGSASATGKLLIWQSHKKHSAIVDIDDFTDFVIHYAFHLCIF